MLQLYEAEQFYADIKQLLSKRGNGTNTELEWRLVPNGKTKLSPFELLKHWELDGAEPDQYTTITYQNCRCTIRGGKTKTWDRKIKIADVVLPYQPVGLKLNLKLEESIQAPGDPGHPLWTREISRWSTEVAKGLRLDISRVRSWNNEGSKPEEWEVELEFLTKYKFSNKIPTPQEVLDPIVKILDVYYSTEPRLNVMTDVQIRYALYDIISAWRGYPTAGFLPKIETRPVNYKRGDDITGPGWWVSNKLDGRNYIVIIFDNQIYAISATDGMHLGTAGKDVAGAMETGAWMDGEWDPHKGHMWIYDYKSPKTKSHTYAQRRKICEELVRLIDAPVVVLKNAIPCVAGSSINKMLKYMTDTWGKRFKEYNDGLIFTNTDRVIKWKWISTIDMGIAVITTNPTTQTKTLEFYAAGDKNVPQVVPEVKLTLDVKSPWWSWVYPKLILELAYDTEIHEFYIYKARPDKLNPNYIRVVKETLNDMYAPVALRDIDPTVKGGAASSSRTNPDPVGMLPPVPDQVLEDAKVSIRDDDRTDYQPIYMAMWEWILNYPDLVIVGAEPLYNNPYNQVIWQEPIKVYTNNGLRFSNDLANHLYSLNRIVFLKTVIPYVEFDIMVLNRHVIKVYMFAKNTGPIYSWIPSADKKFKLLSPTADLKAIYHTLYKPFSKEWEAALAEEKAIYEIFKTREWHPEETKDGGGKPSKEAPTIKERSLVADLRKKIFQVMKYEVGQIGLLIGHWSVVEHNSDPEDWPVNEKIQFLTNLEHQGVQERLTATINGIATFKFATKFSSKTETCNLVDDILLERTTHYISIDGGVKIALIDTYNSLSYELVPYVERDGIRVAAPEVICRFALIDYWMLKIIKHMGHIPADVADRKLLQYLRLLAKTRPKIRVAQTLAGEIPPNYEGVFKDQIIERRKVLQQQDKFRPYKPLEYAQIHNEMLTIDQFLDKHIDKLNWGYASAYQPWSWLQGHQDRIDWWCASCNRTIPPEVLEQHIDELNWESASQYQPWSWLQSHQDRIRWPRASANKTILPEVLTQHLDELDWDWASRYQPWSWLQNHQDRIMWGWASCNRKIPPEVLDQHLDELDWDYASQYQPWSWLQCHQDRIRWGWASCNRKIPPEVLEQHLDELDWSSASLYQSWNWLQCYQDRINWHYASGNTTIPPNVLIKHSEQLGWWNISYNNFGYQRAIEKLRSVRRHVKSFHIPNWWKLSRLVKTRQFCEWYYHPDNIGGQIAKRRIAGLFNQN